MTVETAASKVRYVGLLDSLREEWLKLLLPAAREVGAAAQTLAGIVRATQTETFRTATELTRYARVPPRTYRAHLRTLADAGWIVNAGRGRTPGGRPRRTATLTLTAKARAALKEDWAPLPWWACCRDRRGPYLPWSARVVLAVVLRRVLELKAVATEREETYAADNLDGLVDYFEEDRFRWSQRELAAATGLHKQAIVAAKVELMKYGVIELLGDQDEHGGTTKDLLLPRSQFGAEVEEIGNNRCHVKLMKCVPGGV